MNTSAALKLRPQSELHIALDGYDLAFYPSEVTVFRRLWGEGVPVPEIAERMKRRQVEIAVLVLDQAEAGEIRRRPGGVFGHAQ